MSGLWGDPEDDQATLDALVRETQTEPSAPGFFDGLGEAIYNIPGRSLAALRLTADSQAVAVRPQDELQVMLARRSAANLREREFDAPDEFDPSLPVNKIIEQRTKEIEERTAADWAEFKRTSPDPMTSGLAAQIINPVGDLILRLGAGTVVGGPAVGFEAMREPDTIIAEQELLDQGVDPLTANREAVRMGTLNAGFAFLPGSVPLENMFARAGVMAGANVILGAGSRKMTGDALREAGYGDAAERYRWNDAQAIAIDAILGGFFGAIDKPEARPTLPPEMLDAAMVAQDAQRRDAQSPFGLPVNNEADRQIAAADARAMEQIANGEPIDVADVFRNPAEKFATVAEFTDAYNAALAQRGKTADNASEVDKSAASMQAQEALRQSGFDGVAWGDGRETTTWSSGKRAEYAPIDPDAAIRAELETIFADVRDEIAAVMGDETPTDWMASRGVYPHKFGATTRLRDFLIERAAGMSDAEIAAEFDVDMNAISASLSRFRDRVEARVARGDTLQNIAEEMRLTMDVVEKAMELKPTRKPEARDVVLSLAMKGLDNGQIAERMRGMGFERTTKESVKVMKSNLRKAGHDIPKGAKGGTDFQASRGEAPVAATPKSDLETALARSFGKSSQKLMSTSKVELLNTVDELNAVTGRTLPKDTKAVSNRGKTYIVAQNVSPSEARGILLHEVGVHHGMAEMLGEQGMGRLKVAMDALLATGNPAVKEARALAEGFALKPEHVEEETLAYLVEHHPDMPIVRRLLAQIRQWVWRAFPDLVDLTPDDIAMMAVASLRHAANEDMRQGFGDWMTSFGGALATREGRARWANGKDVKTESGSTIWKGEFAAGEERIVVDLNEAAYETGVWSAIWDFEGNTKTNAEMTRRPGALGSESQNAFGKIIAVLERFVSEKNPNALEFSGLSDAHTRLYSRMALMFARDGYRVWEVSSDAEKKHDFVIAKEGYDVKENWPNAKALERPVSRADIAAKVDKASDYAVAAYMDWFRESGGMDNAGNYIDNMRASRGKKRDTEMNDPVKAAIAEDPTMKIPDEKGELLPVNEALMKADELFKNASELSKGFEAAGACAARHAASIVSQAELRTAELVGGFAWGAATAGAIANVAAPAIMEMNNQAYANDVQRRADEAQAALAEDRAQYIKENPVTSIPVGRSLDNTIMHAADRTGVPENFLSALIKKESGGDANAKAATSSATGMTQFIDGTWRNELIRVGSKLGFKGDPYSAEALELRKDPRWSVMVAAEYAKANAQDLKAAIGRDPTHGEVYLAHFMGLGGAIDLINAAEQGAPNAAALFPAAAAANQNVFHGSAKDVLKRQTKGFSNEPFVVNQ